MQSIHHWVVRAALAIVVVLASVPVADAKTVSVTVGGRPITLVIDPDQCELDRNNPSDTRVYDLVERGLAGRNQLLMAAADCQQIPAWRSGSRPTLDDFTQVQVNLALRERELSGREAATSKEICTELRKQGDAIVNGPEVTEVRNRFNKLTDTVQLNATTFIGVVHEDDQACYASLVQKVRTEQGRDKLILSVFAHVVLRGRLLYIYRFTEGDSFERLVHVTEQLQRSVAAHIEANR